MLKINGVRFGGENVIVTLTYTTTNQNATIYVFARQGITNLNLKTEVFNPVADGKEHTTEASVRPWRVGGLVEKFKPGEIWIGAHTIDGTTADTLDNLDSQRFTLA